MQETGVAEVVSVTEKPPSFKKNGAEEPVYAIGRKRAGVVDDQVGVAEVFQLMLRWPDEHGMHEERVIWPRANHANLDAIFWVPPRETVGR
jgi:hypothetical protein